MGCLRKEVERAAAVVGDVEVDSGEGVFLVEGDTDARVVGRLRRVPLLDLLRCRAVGDGCGVWGVGFRVRE
jgi:hypothetical protein